MSSSQTPPSNETETPENAAATPATQSTGDAPFRRGQIVWGRPPQAVFRAGPLPRDEGLARLMAMPPHPAPPKPMVRGSTAVGTGNGLMGGSNIPQGQPRTGAPAATKPSVISGGGLMSGSLVPGAGMPRPQAKAPEAVPSAPIVPEQVSEPVVDSVLEPIVASSARRTRPAVDMTPDTPRSAAHVSSARKKPSRLMMAATAALVIAAGAAAVWWSQKDHPDNPPVASETAAPETVAPETAAPENAPAPAETVAPVEAASVPVQDVAVPAPVAAPPAVTAPKPAMITAREQPAPAPVTSTPTARPAVVPETQAPVPVVTVTPPAVDVVAPPPPTAAAPQQNDPDAPVTTRPQKLD